MCGLTGVFGENVWNADEDTFKDGLVVAQLRGPDSTGIGVVSGHKMGCSVLKAAQDSTAFVARKDVSKLFQRLTQTKVLMGHTRWATMGSIQDKNAHPFIHGHIMLAHNGGIWNKEEIADGAKFDVDSEAICHGIYKNGAIETIKTLNGHFALTYYDYDKKTFNIIRNSGRPLFMTKHKDRNTWYYNSEYEMLDLMVTRNKIPFNEIVEVPEATLITFDLVKNTLTDSKVVIPNPMISASSGSTRTGGGFHSTDRSHYHGPYGNNSPWFNDGYDEEDDRRCLPPPPAESSSNNSASSGTNQRTADPERNKVTDFRTVGEAQNPPHGSGPLYLSKWGLALNDTIELFVYDTEYINGKSHHMKGDAMFAAKDFPPAHVVVKGFTDANLSEIKNDIGNYYSRITQCIWDGKEYVITCHGLFNRAPATVSIPHKPIISLKDIIAKKILEAVKKDDQVILPLPDNDTSGESKESDEKVITINDLDDEDMARLSESLALQGYEDTEMIDGPGGRSISYRLWKEFTKDGCCNCTTDLSSRNVKWYGDFAFCSDCYAEEESKRDAKRAI